jgi:acylphosphatase
MPMNPTKDAGAVESRMVRVRGLVQGVGYRDGCIRHAQALGVTGWVRNRSDGSVEAMLQGTPAQLDALCSRLRDGIRGAQVDELAEEVIAPPVARHERFERLPTL